MPDRFNDKQTMRSRIESLLSEFLYKQGSLNLPAIGVIRCENALAIDNDEDTGAYRFSPESLGFEYAPRTELDDELVTHIARETGKMKSLAASDLQSYLEFGQELINIGKPFHIKGLGVLQKTATQDIEFVPEEDPRSNTERGGKPGTETRHHASDVDAPFSYEETTASFLPRNLLWGVGLLLTIIGGYALFKYLRDSGGTSTKGETVVVLQKPDTLQTDTASKAASTETGSANPGVFRVVLENSNRERALSRYADLKEWGHDIRMSTKDSSLFKLYIPIDAPLSDTARHRDSLRIFFGRPVRVETGKNE
jgi:hypothetical protein